MLVHTHTTVCNRHPNTRRTVSFSHGDDDGATSPAPRWWSARTSRRPSSTGSARASRPRQFTHRWSNLFHIKAAPPCLGGEERCAGSSCAASAAAPYYARRLARRGSRRRVKKLRIFFLEGHVGPMNDMLATLHDVLGMERAGVEGMTFMQGMLNRNQIDQRFFGCRLCLLGHNNSREIAAWLQDRPTTGRAPLPGAKSAVDRPSDHAVRHEFARRFGALFERSYDAVACNFPTWQCAPPPRQRQHHHALHPPLRPPRAGQPPRPRTRRRGRRQANSIAAELGRLLRRMARRPHVLLAVSNAYDFVYLKRNLGLSAVPWPGLSAQLARIQYTGADTTGRARREVLFCCGAQPYNQPLELWAETITNTTRLIYARRRMSPLSARAGGGSSEPPRFAWLNDLYPRSWQCKRVKAARPSGDANHTAPNGDAALPSTNTAGRRLRAKKDKAAASSKLCTRRSVATAMRTSRRIRWCCCSRTCAPYGLVNAYSMGTRSWRRAFPLSKLHAATGIVSHKGPGNVPWRPTHEQPIKTWLSRNGKDWHVTGATSPGPMRRAAPATQTTPAPRSSRGVAQFADWYQWPHIRYYSTPIELVDTVDAMLANVTSRGDQLGQKAFFAAEVERTSCCSPDCGARSMRRGQRSAHELGRLWQPAGAPRDTCRGRRHRAR